MNRKNFVVQKSFPEVVPKVQGHNIWLTFPGSRPDTLDLRAPIYLEVARRALAQFPIRQTRNLHNRTLLEGRKKGEFLIQLN